MVGRMEPDALDLATVGGDAFEAPAGGMLDRFARLEDSPGEDEGEAADGVDLVILGGQPGIDRFAQFLELVRGQGSAALVATHNERLAQRMDRVARIHDGVIEEAALPG